MSLRLKFKELIFKFMPITATRILHYKVTGKKISLSHPRTFNEKLQWLKLNYNDPLAVKLADKYEVYNYLKNNGFSAISNKLYFVVDNVEDIPWNKLPKKFVLKCTHGCGYNICVTDIDKHDLEKEKLKLAKWLSEDFGKLSYEPHYSKIQPRVIGEKFIENSEGELPIDYKIYCFHGEPKVVLVCSERENNLRLDFFDLSWRRMNLGHPEDQSSREIRKPICFDKMVEYSKKMSKPFPFVRIDFYDNDGKAVFGEFTFTPAGNMANYYNDEANLQLGNMLDLNKLPQR